ncbi:3-hydroxyacyl-CoA dehydrogenase NAD-binding domain-containing protein [Kordiimonas gwangyangensis]|uniref:3-hydroxyacyl-CoA dehydrogenase NAD-binding domain-containing protein n=1 Tax=Kordiimonas gwangyangensis TaxID=288022 RepID=UPI0003824965|nr:3-hydroxyacyl-CoA dehydrogenase NAD-binding domain-containing protein [Kordiimonas gwangyangensis]
MSTVSTEIRDGIAIITVDNPPVNALSHSVREGLSNQMKELSSNADVSAIVIACAGRTFIAGADIREFGRPPQPPHLTEVVLEIEAMEKPVVAAIHGTALGGGLEVALSCHYRVALSSAKIGLPEVKLGILPGAGGTQRLPRIAGPANALDAIVSGRHISAKEAKGWGVLDELVEDNLLDAAIAFAKAAVDMGPRRTGEMTIDSAKFGPEFFDGFRKSVAKQTRGYFAPERCIQCVEAAVNLPFDEGMKRERELFQECFTNPQAKALQHMFFAERQVSRIPGIDKDTPRREIKRVGIIGAGTMGGGIAMNFANVGIPVTILEVEQAALDRGLGVVRKNYERSAAKGKLTAEQVEGLMSQFTGTLSYDDLSDCDLIIEAVFETMDIKKKVFTELDRVAKPGAILASNTSYLDVDAIAACTKRPEDVLGLHFFSPANVMRLLEIVRAEKTSPEVLATCVDLAKTIRKVGVVAGVCHGFIGNRMLSPYGREAALSVIEGAKPEEVDAALFNFGMPMGPMTMSDMAGLDIGYLNRQGIGRENYETKAYDWMDRLVEAGRKGLKVGAGVYAYDEGSRTPKPDPEVMKIIEEESAKAGIERKPISADAIVERCMMALINEGAKILGEGIAYRASDIDVVYVNGYGYPPYRGGPMHYADHLGLKTVYAKICEYADTVGDRWWKPAPLLKELAEAGKSFADYDRENAG